MSEHDDLPPTDAELDDLDETERALADRLSVVLSDRAGSLVVADKSFDPTRRSTLDPGDRTSTPPLRAAGPLRRKVSLSATVDAGTDSEPAALDPFPITTDGAAGRGWIVWIAGAAAAAVLVAAIVMVNAVRVPSIEVGDEPAPLLVDRDGAWAPSWVPDGLELWQFDTTFGDPMAIVAGASVDQGARRPVLQLLEEPGGEVRVLVNIGEPDPVASTTGAPVVVRGEPGTWSPDQAMGSGSPSGITIEWGEGGSAFGAFVIGADVEAAVTLLDGLSLVEAADPERGFAAPSDGSLRSVVDDPSTRPARGVAGAMFGYERGRPEADDLTLEVLTLAGGSPTLGFPGYLPTALLGSLGDDGVARAFLPASNGVSAVSYTVWPDGRTVYSSGTELDEQSASRIAASVVPISGEEVAARADAVSAKLGTGQLLASVRLSSGLVEVIGSPEAMAICLTAKDRQVCRLPKSLSDRGSSVLVGSAMIGGNWYVFGADDEGEVDLAVASGSGGFVTTGTAVATPVDPTSLPPTVVEPVPTTAAARGVPIEDGSTSSSVTTSLELTDPGLTAGSVQDDRSVPAESAASGSWKLALLVVPTGVDAVSASFPGESIVLPRPMR